MSKSKGNFLTLRSACPNPDDIRAYRYLVVSSQYRNPLSFTTAAMGAAKSALTRMDKLRKQMEIALEEVESSYFEKDDSESDIVNISKDSLKNFEIALSDDLSMPRAAACLFQIVKAGENEFKRFKKETEAKEKNDSAQVTPLDLKGIYAIYKAMNEMDKVFGIFYTVPSLSTDESSDTENENDDIPAEVMELVGQRTIAKDAKDWEMADSLRDRIQELGFSVKDVKGGMPEVSRIN